MSINSTSALCQCTELPFVFSLAVFNEKTNHFYCSQTAYTMFTFACDEQILSFAASSSLSHILPLLLLLQSFVFSVLLQNVYSVPFLIAILHQFRLFIGRCLNLYLFYRKNEKKREKARGRKMSLFCCLKG